MFEFEDEVSKRLLKPFICSVCFKTFPSFDKSTRPRLDENICKYCTGELVDHCKNCAGEDCCCCERNPNSSF